MTACRDINRSEIAGQRERFCRENFDLGLFDGAVQSIWFDKTGLLSWPGWVVRLELVEGGSLHQGKFDAIEVRIVKKDLGEVDKKWFLFRDYLPKQATQKKFPSDESEFFPYVSDWNDELVWHRGDQPDDLARLLAPINVYIEEWVRGLSNES